MTLRDAYRAACARLSDCGIESPETDAKWLLTQAAAAGPESRFSETPMTAAQNQSFFAAVERRCAGEPLQYILGEWEFYSLPILVAPGVLIPRPETELLVETALSLIPEGVKSQTLDLCTGTGCIAAALALHSPQTAVTAVDLYDAPLRVAAENFARLSADVRLETADALSPPPASMQKRFDLIVSNPPYVTAGEMQSLARELSFEPEQALFGGNDGLDFYRSIAENWCRALKPGGWLALEIGCSQSGEVSALLSGNFEEIRVLRDYADNDRVIIAKCRP